MTSVSKKSSQARGPYRDIAIVKLTPEYAAQGQLPVKISEHARGIEKVIRCGTFYFGKTGAFPRAYAAAETLAAELNHNKPDDA